MAVTNTSYLTRACQLLFVLISSTVVLYYGRSLLVPLAFAWVLAFLLLPLCRRLEAWRLPRPLAVVLCILLLAGFFAGLFYLLSWQLSDIMQNGAELKTRINGSVSQVQNWLAEHF